MGDTDGAIKQRHSKSIHLPPGVSSARAQAHKVVKSNITENVMAAVAVFYFVLVVYETDAKAKEETIPVWCSVVSWVVLALFAIQMLLRIYVYRADFWRDKWSLMDFVIITVDLVGSFLSLFMGHGEGAAVLRILRMTRIARTSKILKAVPELRLMVAGLVGAMHSIFWGVVFLSFALLIWSVLAVQYIHPLNQDLTDKGVWRDLGCERCPRAFESVFQSFLTFLQQIVAGDSWGLVTVPLIEHYPPTIIYFVAVLASVGLAILNLILGVVVNVATAARDDYKAELDAETRLHAQARILDILTAMDTDGNHMFSKNEIIEGYETHEEFREMMANLDIMESDMEIVWSHLDEDGDGTVSAKEFALQISRMKSSDTSFMLSYIKQYMRNMGNGLLGHFSKIEEDMKSLSARLERISIATSVDIDRTDLGDIKLYNAPAAKGFGLDVTFADKEFSSEFADKEFTNLHACLQQALDSVVDMRERSLLSNDAPGAPPPLLSAMENPDAAFRKQDVYMSKAKMVREHTTASV